MKKFVILVLLCTLAPSAFALRKVAVAEAERLLAEVSNKSDRARAHQIGSLELTERCSSARFKRWQAAYPGKRTSEALLLLADASALLNLPATELPPEPEPSLEEKKRILVEAVHHLSLSLPSMPNFLANRQTVFYEDIPLSSPLASISYDFGQPPLLHAVAQQVQRIAYRDGHEVLDEPGKQPRTPARGPHALITSGEFGSILQLVLFDAAKGEIRWSHWEPSEQGKLAAFSYSVPAALSHYTVTFPCGEGSDDHHPAYHGEFAIQPETGAILRLSVISSLARPCLEVSSSITTEFGPVEIGGKSYICPLHSISISHMPFRVAGRRGEADSFVPSVQLNDVRFSDYRRFRSESRIVSVDGFVEPPPAQP